MSYEQIWAPWRLSYLIDPRAELSQDQSPLEFLPGADPDCFLCRSAVDPDNPARHVVECGTLTVTLLNRFPYNNGHLLVAPRRHCGRLDDLGIDEQTDLLQTIAKMVNLVEKVLKPHGFNLGLNIGAASGAGVPGHLHWHIVPRWNGDTNFMLTVAGVKVIPQALSELRATLVNALKAPAATEDQPSVLRPK